MEHSKIIERLQAIGITGDKAAHCFALLDEINRGDMAFMGRRFNRLDEQVKEIARAVGAAVFEDDGP